MPATVETEKPYRVGIFRTVADADRAIRNLLAAGFTEKEIAVICSDKHKEHLLHHVQHPKPDDSYSPKAIAAGSVIGAAIGGIALAAATAMTGGAALLAGAGVLVGGGAIGGAFVGAMSLRGLEGELGAYYEQAVRLGQILVAVELMHHPDPARLERAEQILAENGAEPVALTEANVGKA